MPFSLNVPSRAGEDVYALDESWSNWRHDPELVLKMRSLTSTTSWQEYATRIYDADHRFILKPAASVPYLFGSKKVPRSVAWVGNPLTGELAILTAVLAGMRKQGVSFKFTAAVSGQPGPEVVDRMKSMGCTTVDVKDACDLLNETELYVAPAMQPTSHDSWAVAAACSDCLVLYPMKYGYPETLGSCGVPFIHSPDNSAYGVFMASTIHSHLGASEHDVNLCRGIGKAARAAFSTERFERDRTEIEGALAVISGKSS